VSLVTKSRASLQAAKGRAYIGISGWNYPPWRGVFYPPGLRQADELQFASRSFSSIELNGSFYSLIRPESYANWYRQTPPGFVFAIKGSRFITHMKRLRDSEVALANFFASGLLCLKEKLGPILWQLPPTFKFDPERLGAFFRLLPKTTQQAASLAKRHDARLSGRSATIALHEAPLRHALEVRHPSFLDPAYVQLLREHGIASCVADTAGLYPVIEDLTTDFVYARLHGATELYTSGYDNKQLSAWAKRIRAWLAGSSGSKLLAPEPAGPALPRDVFVYFDNDVKVRAPFDAQNLRQFVEGKRRRPLPSTLASVTEEPRTQWPAWRAS
jgi:uncharacterized protein YecE (DUF72 family)